MKIFLLCQGEGTRWGERSPELPEFKQMIQVAGEPNLMRTVGMLEAAHLDYTIIGRGEMLTPEQHERIQGRLRTLQWSGNTILAGVLQLLTLDEPVLFLLGDVVFSRQMFGGLSYCCYSLPFAHFSGRRGANKETGKEASEIFSLFIPEGDLSKVREALKSVDGTKLWDLNRRLDLPIFEHLGDWTDDIDSPEEYEQFYPALNRAAEREK